MLVALMYCSGGWDKHWFTKNYISMTLGTLSIGWSAWSIVTGHPWMNTSYTVIIVTLSLYIGGTSNVQDLSDVEGDKKTG